MILPTKHIPTEYSLIGIGACILRAMPRSSTVSVLWDRVKRLPEVGTFERYVLALTFLYAIGAIRYEDGVLWRDEHDPSSQV